MRQYLFIWKIIPYRNFFPTKSIYAFYFIMWEFSRPRNAKFWWIWWNTDDVKIILVLAFFICVHNFNLSGFLIAFYLIIKLMNIIRLCLYFLYFLLKINCNKCLYRIWKLWRTQQINKYFSFSSSVLYNKNSTEFAKWWKTFWTIFTISNYFF